MNKTRTLKEDIILFQDSLGEMLPEKIKSVVEEYNQLKIDIRERYKANKQKCESLLVRFNIPIGEYELYWLFVLLCDFKLNKMQMRLSEIKVELTNLMSAWNILKGVLGNDKNILKVEEAREYPIENLYMEKMKKSGSKLIGKCPFHQEEDGSFTIYTNTNTFYCFGCRSGGSVIDFIMKLEGINFEQAVRRLT